VTSIAIAHAAPRRALLGPALYFVGLAILLIPYTIQGHVADRTRFIIATVVLTIYLAGEMAVEASRDPRGWLLHPAVLASLGTFLLPFTFTNYALLDVNGGGYMRLLTGLEAEDGYYWLARGMDLVLPGAPAMWLAYRSGLSDRLARATRTSLQRWGLLGDAEPRRFAVPALIAIAVISRAAQLKLGVLGYAADVEALYEHSSLTMLLTRGSDLARLALVLVALRTFGKRGSRDRPLLIALLIFEMLFGFVLGFKGRVVAPFLTVAVCAYAVRGRVPWSMAIGGVAALAAAYVVIEPFRLLRYADPNFDGRSISYLVTSLRRAQVLVDEKSSRQFLTNEAGDITAMRTNSALDVAVVRRFVDTHGVPADAPPFLSNLIFSPIHAVVPRVVWKSKPLQNIGVWYAQTVWKQENSLNSLGMTPFGYLYFAGGAATIMIGFALLGLFQRWTYESFRHAGLTGLLVYLAGLPSIAIADSAFYTIFAGNLQIVILALLVLRVVLRPVPGGSREAR
jgi:hypothetical protein